MGEVDSFPQFGERGLGEGSPDSLTAGAKRGVVEGWGETTAEGEHESPSGCVNRLVIGA
jgi:hypothetical protein